MGVYEELHEAKAEIEKLKLDYQTKLELSESLKKALNEQKIKIQQVGLEVKKLSQELGDKAEELSTSSLMCEELKSKLKEKDSVIKHLTSANDKLRADWKEKLQRCEEDNRGLALALDEVNAKNMDQEKQIHSLREEIQGLKGFVSFSQNKFSKADKNAKTSKEERQRDDILLNLEEEKSKYENQLKWKKEQFSHLEDAHKKLKSQFQVKEKEWETQKTSLLDEISALHTNLDSQVRIAESLKSRLEMCNNALAHEESKRKRLEVELCESKAQFDNVLTEFEEAKSQIENLTYQRDEEIARLRNSLGTKESHYKEMEYQVRWLEQEKQELTLSLKALQEAQIQEAGNSSSLAKLRNKLRNLEHVHKDCPTRLKDKEMEWSNQLQDLMQKLDWYSSELESTKVLVEKLKNDAETRDSEIIEQVVHKEEATLMLLVFKSEFSEAQKKLYHVYQEKDSSRENLSLLLTQLDMKSSALTEAQNDFEEERRKVIQLSEKVASFTFTEEEKLSLLKEIERQGELQHESDAYIHGLKEQLQSMENELNEVRNALHKADEALHEKFCDGSEFELLIWKSMAQQLKANLEEEHQMYREVQASLHGQLMNMKGHLEKLCGAVDAANEELAAKFCEVNEVEFELQIWKSVAEQLKSNLEENQQMRKEVEASLLAEVEVEENLKQENNSLLNLIDDKDQTLDGLQQQLISLNGELGMRDSRRNVTPATIENEKGFEDYEEEDERMKKELEGAVLAQVDAERNYEHDKESLHHLVEEKDQRIEDLQQLVKSLEQEFESSTSSFSLRLSHMQVEINSFHEAWDKVVASMILKEIEAQEKNLIVAEIQDDLTRLEVDLQVKESEVGSLKNKLEKLNAEKDDIFEEVMNLSSERETLFEAIEGLSDRLEQELNKADVLVEEFNAEKGNIIQDVVKLSSERANIVDNIEGLAYKIENLSREDMQLMENLARIVQSFDSTQSETTGNEFLEKENIHTFRSPRVTKAAIPEEDNNSRSPLRALNN